MAMAGNHFGAWKSVFIFDNTNFLYQDFTFDDTNFPYQDNDEDKQIRQTNRQTDMRNL